MCLKHFFANQRKRPTLFFGNKMAKIFDVENEKHNDFVISLLDLQPTDHVLEIGFGSGSAISKIAKIVTSGLICGIDHSGAMVREAKKLNQKTVGGGMIQLKKGDVTKLPYPDNNFDKAFAVFVIYFWNDSDSALKEINRVLKPNGKLIIYPSTKETLAKMPFTQTGVFNSFTEAELIKLFNTAGFTNISIKKAPLDEDRVRIAVIGYKIN